MDGISQTLGKLGTGRLVAMTAATLFIFGFFAFVGLRFSATDMSLLYSELSAQDRNAIAVELERLGIGHSVDNVTGEVKVKDRDVGRARMLLAEKGLPDGGSIGYEIFDRDEGFGQTRFKQNINRVRALEGELVRTISTLQPVKSARIHLVLPERELFSREAQPATASVFLKLIRGRQLSQEQVIGIQYLVAAAVPQLDPKRVSIVDQAGNLLASGTSESDPGSASKDVERLRLNYERRLRDAIEQMVGRIVGFGRVRAQVTADIDFDRVTTNAEIFDPEGQIARSTQTSEEQNNESTANNNDGVTVDNNLPGLPGEDGAAGGNDTRNSNRIEEIVNYEISRTVKSHVREGGDVRKLSVAVLLDGTYTTDEEDNQIYAPRAEDELARIRTLVASAVGYDEDRGDTLEVVNMQFADMEEIGDLPDNTVFMGLSKADLIEVAETVTLGVVAILFVLVILRPLLMRFMPAPATGGGNLGSMDEAERALLTSGGGQQALAPPGGSGEGGAQQALPGAAGASGSGGLAAGLTDESNGEDDDDGMIDLAAVDGKIKASTVRKVSEIVDEKPAETVAVIRNWMFQDT